MFDCIDVETRPGNRSLEKVIELARESASGGDIMRGGQDHKSFKFKIRNCFMFNSIVPPALKAQDLSRIVTLELRPLDTSAKRLDLDAAKWANVGSKLRRRLMKHWKRFDQTFMQYDEALRKLGHGSRGCDTIGTLLTCADLLLFENVPDNEHAEAWAEGLSPTELGLDDVSVEPWRACLDFLLQQQIDQFEDRSRLLVLEWVEKAIEEIESGESTRNAQGPANKVLARHGLRISVDQTLSSKEGLSRFHLAIANSHNGVGRLFDNSLWQTKPGASSPWSRMLARAPGAKSANNTFNNVRSRSVVIPCTLFLEASNPPTPEEV